MNNFNEIVDLCIEIFASERLDQEVTINGNGVNSSEAVVVADAIFRILNLSEEDFEEKIQEKIYTIT